MRALPDDLGGGLQAADRDPESQCADVQHERQAVRLAGAHGGGMQASAPPHSPNHVTEILCGLLCDRVVKVSDFFQSINS